MRREKVAGALQRPNGTWLNSYSCPLLVRNAVFALSLSVMGTEPHGEHRGGRLSWAMGERL